MRLLTLLLKFFCKKLYKYADVPIITSDIMENCLKGFYLKLSPQLATSRFILLKVILKT